MFAATTILHGNIRDNYATLSKILEGNYDWSLISGNTYKNFVEEIKKFNFEKKYEEDWLMTTKVLMSHEQF